MSQKQDWPLFKSIIHSTIYFSFDQLKLGQSPVEWGEIPFVHPFVHHPQLALRPLGWPSNPSSWPSDPSGRPLDTAGWPSDPTSWPLDPSCEPLDPSSWPRNPSSWPCNPSSWPSNPVSWSFMLVGSEGHPVGLRDELKGWIDG